MTQAVTDAFTVANPSVTVNLLFDHENDDVAVESPYTYDVLTVRLKRPYFLLVRMPPWVDRKQMTITGATAKHRWLATPYLFFEKQPAGTQVRIKFPLAEEEITLGKPHPQPIRVRLRGDAVAAMENFGAPLRFFPGFGEE